METREQAVIQNRFLLSLSRLSPSTRANYARVIERFRKYAPSKIEQIGREHIESYLLTLQSKQYRATTLNLHLTSLKVFFSWLENEYGIENIAKKVKYFQTIPPRRRILNKKEYIKLIESTDGYVKDCLVFLANSGLRATEFVTLKPENIGEQFIEVVGKGRKFRRIPLNQTLHSVLKSNPHLNFIKSKDRTWVNRLCIRAAKAAGIPKFSPHSLRRYFATQLYHQGVSLLIISRLLGHSSIQTTEIYLGLSDAELLGSTNCLD